MRHPLHIKGYNGSLSELASAIGAMRYDKVAELLGHLAKELVRQSNFNGVNSREKKEGAQHSCLRTPRWVDPNSL